MKARRVAKQNPKSRHKKTAATDNRSLAADVQEPSISDVALLAVHLLPWSFKPNDAVELAYTLWDACRDEAEKRSVEDIVLSASKPENTVRFKEGVAQITGLKDKEHGLAVYREFCREVFVPLLQKMNSASPEIAQSSDAKSISVHAAEIVATAGQRNFKNRNRILEDAF